MTGHCALSFSVVWWLQLFITARDQGVPLSMTSETSILCVTLVDINDEPPTFAVVSARNVTSPYACRCLVLTSLLLLLLSGHIQCVTG